MYSEKCIIENGTNVQIKLELEEVVNNIKKHRINFALTSLKMLVKQKSL
ncbi:hypothetical protein J6Q66_01530 [bacterium]|nr:hypothetical protein [bacterium]